MALFTINTGFAQEKTSEFEVLGNCNGCKKRIEKAASAVEGVSSVNWDKETKIIKVIMARHTNIIDVANAIEAAGHDTEFNKANDAMYEELPGCCQYDREGTENTEASTAKTVASFNFEVSGNCGMCKKRIEKAAKAVSGVTNATWDKESKVINIDVSDATTTKEQVSKAIATIGHDTEFNKAEATVYDDLPGCCQYDRDEANETKTTAKIVKSYSFSVNGKCGMCKKRIEKAAKSIPEVVSAVWDKETKILTVGVSNKKGKKKNISKAIASVGHDTEFDKASQTAYDDLPGCCYYDRIQ